MRNRAPFSDVALSVVIVFGLERPMGHYGTGKNGGVLRASAPIAPSFKPDIDKLTRTTLDAMQGPVFDEDSRIVHLVASKVYAAAACETGAVIVVMEARVTSLLEQAVEFDHEARAFMQGGASRRQGTV
jgi:Holliday junction resolvase RusA-like endonuclease